MTFPEFKKEWSGIDDRFLLEAAQTKAAGKRRAGHIAALIAACLALLVGAPCLLLWRLSPQTAAESVPASGLGKEGEVEIVAPHWHIEMSSIRGHIFRLRCPGGQIEIQAARGELLLQDDAEFQNVVVEAGKNAYTMEEEALVCWSPPVLAEGEGAYVTAVFRREGQITAAAVIRTVKKEDGFYRAELLDSLHVAKGGPEERESTVQSLFDHYLPEEFTRPPYGIVS